MLFHPYYISKPVRVQGAFVSDDEVTEVVNFLNSAEECKRRRDQTQILIFRQICREVACQAVIRMSCLRQQEDLSLSRKRTSIGNLQRHLRIGFNRAARIMDQLYAAGVVSKDEGTKPRKVLMKAEEFEEYLQSR